MLPPFKMSSRVFANPLQGIVFKYLMGDELFRNSFVRIFTPLKNVVSTTIETNALRIAEAEKMLNFMNTDWFKGFLKDKIGSNLPLSFMKIYSDPANLYRCAKTQ